METNDLPKFGSLEFWEYYDQFCEPANLETFINNPESHSESPLKMHLIMHAAHLTREIHGLKRPEKSWNCIEAFLVLKACELGNDEGRPWILVRRGDVIIRQHQWNRDVPITHTPSSGRIPCGAFTSGKWPDMVGICMPLFKRETILTCIELCAKRDLQNILETAQKEANDWDWPV